LKSVIDPKLQVTTYAYNLDDTLQQESYTNATIATPSVSYTYDTAHPRIVAVVDGVGTTAFTYTAVVDGPLTNDTTTYGYDELGRVVTRAVNGASNQVTRTDDALGRVVTEVNPLGTFTYGYDGVMSRLASVTYPNGQTGTFTYYDNTSDRRLQTLHNKYPGGATLSKFDYAYDAGGAILTVRQ
jgi:YD repeat-containing protein